MALIRERCPPGVDVEAEVVLSLEPQKADLLVLHEHGARLTEGRVLRRLWPMLSPHTVVEFKSVSRAPRDGDLLRLLGYGVQYHTRAIDAVGAAENLSLVLVAASMTSALERDRARLGWTRTDLGDGYHRLEGGTYRCFLVLVDEVAEAEQDPLLGAFGHRTLDARDQDVVQWFLAHFPELEDVEMSDLEGWKELIEKLRRVGRAEVLLEGMKPEERLAGMKPEERLAGMKPEERLAGLTPEERSAGLSPDETVLVLADDVLRRLPRDFVDGLPEPVRDEVLRRIAASNRH